MRQPLRECLVWLCGLFALALSGTSPAAEPEAPAYRVVFEYRPEGPASGNDYESRVTVFERGKGGEKLVGTFRGSVFPDDMKVKGRLKDGSYDLYLGLHRRSKDGKALTPTKADLVVKSQGWLRPALIVNEDKAVPVVSLNPKKKTSTYIHVHNGFTAKRSSDGCLTLAPPDWERFISIFLKRYPDFDDWHRGGRYYGRKVAVLEVRSAR